MNLPDLDAVEHAVRSGRKFGYATVGEWVLLAPGISDRAVRIYCLLRMHCQGIDERAWPAQKTLAEMLGIKKTDGIGRAIQELVALGAVDVEVTAHARGRRNVYVVHEAPPEGYSQGPLDRNDFYDRRDDRSSGGVTPESGVTPDLGVTGDPQIRGDGSPPARGSEVTQLETTQLEKEEGGVPTAVGHQRAGDEPPPPSLPSADWRDPASWMCREHLAQFRDDPGADRPPCGKCARVREWAQQQQAEHQRATAEAEQAEVDLAASCRMHDEFGWRIDPVTREPLGAIKCDHVTPHEEIARRVLAAKEPEPAVVSSESVRAAAMASARSLAAKRRTSTPGFPDQGVSGHTDHVEARTG
jgi:hypothetical protein